MIDADRLRSRFLAFFAEGGHVIVPSASLIPEGDPSVLFTTVSVHPLVPYLRGRPHPAGRLLADCQKCLRTTDIAEVGDATHLTSSRCWETGRWAITSSASRSRGATNSSPGEDLLAIPPQRLWISVFAGNQVAHVRDAIGRRWQMSTLQVDFQLPHRFGLEYTGADNARHRPHMIHRALFGSIKRFLAVVLEDYAGALPPGRVRPARRRHRCRQGPRQPPAGHRTGAVDRGSRRSS